MRAHAILNTGGRLALAGLASAEGYAWFMRWRAHCDQLRAALARASELGRPVIIFGDWGPCTEGKRSLGYGFSVVYSVDGSTICESAAPKSLAEFPDDSAVGFIAGVLEHASDPDAILTELQRIAGEHLFYGARLQPWTLSAAVLARRTGNPAHMKPVSPLARVGGVGLLSIALAFALWPKDARG